jgi:hypothetical protein
MDLLKQGIYIAVAKNFIIADFTIWAEIADTFTKRDMDIET